MKTATGKSKSAVPIQERLLTKEEVAVRLGVRPRTVATWANDGRLPVIHAGRRLRFRWSDVDAFLRSSFQSALQGRQS